MQANGSYHASFELETNFNGKDIYIELGPLVGLDSIFINGVYAGNYRDMEPHIRQEYPTETPYPDTHRYKMLSRIYILKPGSEAYQAIQFDRPNTLTVKLYHDWMNYGLPNENRPSISVPSAGYSWQATDDALADLGFANPKRKGVNYWGNEQFFNSWSTKNGLFGFVIEGSGVAFCKGTALEGLESLHIPVTATYTDFAVFKPWTFEVLAYTTTRQHFLYPDSEEQYPCIVRIAHSQSGGGYILINPSVAGHPAGNILLNKLTAN
ncbi:MAG: hypothetical protein LUD74_08470 [Tannerellaceae bacterium]|nr:hypothetical protein [Tannerellaceae bacterium]